VPPLSAFAVLFFLRSNSRKRNEKQTKKTANSLTVCACDFFSIWTHFPVNCCLLPTERYFFTKACRVVAHFAYVGYPSALCILPSFFSRFIAPKDSFTRRLSASLRCRHCLSCISSECTRNAFLLNIVHSVPHSFPRACTSLPSLPRCVHPPRHLPVDCCCLGQISWR